MPLDIWEFLTFSALGNLVVVQVEKEAWHSEPIGVALKRFPPFRQSPNGSFAAGRLQRPALFCRSSRMGGKRTLASVNDVRPRR
jgi:hypothetical protein